MKLAAIFILICLEIFCLSEISAQPQPSEEPDPKLDSLNLVETSRDTMVVRLEYLRKYYSTGVLKFEGWSCFRIYDSLYFSIFKENKKRYLVGDTAQLLIGWCRNYDKNGILKSTYYHPHDLHKESQSISFSNSGDTTFAFRYVVAEQNPKKYHGFGGPIAEITNCCERLYKNGRLRAMGCRVNGKRQGEWIFLTSPWKIEIVNYDKGKKVKKGQRITDS